MSVIVHIVKHTYQSCPEDLMCCVTYWWQHTFTSNCEKRCLYYLLCSTLSQRSVNVFFFSSWI